MTDSRRQKDWRAQLALAPQHCGLILRDYDIPERARIAADMADFCRHEKRFFAIAGDRKLARRCGAHFHCPSYLLRHPGQLDTPSALDTAAIHNEKELYLAARAGYQRVFLSPVFATKSHPEERALGPVRAQRLAVLAQHMGLSVYALGGMNAYSFRRLAGTRAAQAPFHGFAAISAFSPPQ